MLTIGDRFPDYELKGVVSEDLKTAFQTFRGDTHKGKWRVVFFYPKDFTFVCPTEIVGYAKLAKQFADRDAVVLGASTDSEFVHLAWRQHNADLKGLGIPLLADTDKKVITAFGQAAARPAAAREAYLIDRSGKVVYHDVGATDKQAEQVLAFLNGAKKS